MVKFLQPEPPPAAPLPDAPEVPVGIKQIGDKLNMFMPMVEQITGLKRNEIFIQLLKTGLKGGSLDSILNGLMGKPPPPEAKFIRYVKTLALWVPIALLLTGLVIVTIILYIKFCMILLGGI